MSRPSVLHLGGFLSQRSVTPVGLYSRKKKCIFNLVIIFLAKCCRVFSCASLADYCFGLKSEVKHFLRQANHCFIGKIRPRLWGWTSKPALFSSLSLSLFWGRGEGRMNEQKTYFLTWWVDIADAYVKSITSLSYGDNEKLQWLHVVHNSHN